MSEIAESRTTVPILSSEELFERFLRLSVADGSASGRTLQAYRAGLTLHLSWCRAAGVDPKTLTYDNFLEYRRWLLDLKLSRATVRLRLTAARALYAALQRWGGRQDNPAAGVKAPKAGYTKTAAILAKALHPEDAQRFAQTLLPPPAAGAMDARDAAICALMLYHGLRAEEICNLENIHLDATTWRTLKVIGKGGKMRTIILAQPAAEILRAWHIVGGQAVLLDFEVFPIFYRLDQPGRRRLSVRSLERIVDRRLSMLGLKAKGRSCHALRHTCAVIAAIQGVPAEAAAEAFGHADIRTQDIYRRAAAAFQQNPGEAVAAALKPPPPGHAATLAAAFPPALSCCGAELGGRHSDGCGKI